MPGLQRRRSSRNLLKLDVLAAEKYAQEHVQKEAEANSCFSPYYHLNMYLLGKLGISNSKKGQIDEQKQQQQDSHTKLA